MTDHIDDYDEKTVDELKEDVRDADLAAQAIEAIAEYERDHKERVTLLEWLDRRTDEADEDDEDEPRVVRVASLDTGMIAGHHFERLNEARDVPYTPRVEDAIANGRLQRIQER